jgi:hypothetical protein
VNLPTVLLLGAIALTVPVAFGFGGVEVWALLSGRRTVSDVDGQLLPWRLSLIKIVIALPIVVVDVVALVALMHRI